MESGSRPPLAKEATAPIDRKDSIGTSPAQELLAASGAGSSSEHGWLAPAAACTPAPDAISDYGIIRRMAVPYGWLDGTRRDDDKTVVPGLAFEEFHPADAPDAHLCLFYRAKKLTNAAADSFQEVLARDPRDLTAQELESLHEVFMERSNPEVFAMSTARTEDLNGKRILVVQGEYRSPQEQIYAVHADSDGTGHMIQEVYFQAPPNLFARYEAEARKAITSIEWR